jgi:hypothetical protein
MRWLQATSVIFTVENVQPYSFQSLRFWQKRKTAASMTAFGGKIVEV